MSPQYGESATDHRSSASNSAMDSSYPCLFLKLGRNLLQALFSQHRDSDGRDKGSRVDDVRVNVITWMFGDPPLIVNWPTPQRLLQ